MTSAGLHKAGGAKAAAFGFMRPSGEMPNSLGGPLAQNSVQ